MGNTGDCNTIFHVGPRGHKGRHLSLPGEPSQCWACVHAPLALRSCCLFSLTSWPQAPGTQAVLPQLLLQTQRRLVSDLFHLISPPRLPCDLEGSEFPANPCLRLEDLHPPLPPVLGREQEGLFLHQSYSLALQWGSGVGLSQVPQLFVYGHPRRPPSIGPSLHVGNTPQNCSSEMKNKDILK